MEQNLIYDLSFIFKSLFDKGMLTEAEYVRALECTRGKAA